VDRLEYLDAADATVLPILHGPPIEHPRLFQGARFVALSTAVRTFASSPYPEGRTVGLVTIGGADPLGLTIPLASAAKAALSATGHTTPLHAIVGPAFKDGDSVARQLLDSGIEVHRGLSRADVVQWMAHSRFALSGFGTSIYDLAALGTPVVYWTHRSQDLPAALRLEERGLGACGGNGGSIDSGDAEAVLRRTVCNDEWCRVASDRGRELVRAADGARAVVELLASPWAA
jgi:spore coat polysaccharide biosynthesis predicted glycosyltransferase SpsG